MAAAASVRDVLGFHRLDRAMYDKLVALGTAPAVSRNVVAVFMWLDLIGVDVVDYIRNNPDQYVILRLAAEAESILDCIRRDSPPRGDSGLAIPLTASLIHEPLNLRFFYSNRDVAVRGITQILDGVGALIFDDYLYALLAEYEGPRGRRAAKLPHDLSRPYVPRTTPAPEDCRSMFITFSKGFPLKREDIVEYFNEKWGDCVERVMMEKTTSSEVTPMYGRIVFKGESFIGLVLNGKQLVKFTIRGRQLWARKYEQRKNAM